MECAKSGEFKHSSFVDGIVLFTENLETANRQMKTLNRLYNPKQNRPSSRNEHPIWDFFRTKKFMYLGEILTLNIKEKAAIEERARKMDMAFRLSYKSKSLSYQTEYTIIK